MGTITQLDRLRASHLASGSGSFITIKQQCYNVQGGRCCYCESPMWMPVKGNRDYSPEYKSFRMLYGLNYEYGRLLMCTIEHLHGRKDGGESDLDNISVACLYCNSKRFSISLDITPYEYKKHVLKHMRLGTWFKFRVHDIFEYTFTPTPTDKLIGGVIRYVRWFTSNTKRLNRLIRLKHYPKQMTLIQCIHSIIRSRTLV